MDCRESSDVNSLDFEGRDIAIFPGDTIASALFRSGVRTFSRSFKYHRRRGLYCLTGDCPNCLMQVDGEACVRACVTKAVRGQRVRREGGWPSVDKDIYAVLDRCRRLLPVGFYYKTLIRPRWLWPLVEPCVRRLAGRGTASLATAPSSREVRNLHPHVVVVGAGIAGLAAAFAAATSGQAVVICEEGRIGATVPPGADLQKIEVLARKVRECSNVTLLENTSAIGIYEGPLVVLDGPSFLHLVHPEHVIVATGAVESHGAFQGNDLPGVWLGRGAARLAGVHGVLPGARVVLVGRTHESAQHAETLRAAGAEVLVVEGDVIEARGRKRVREVVIEDSGRRETFQCDALVLCLGFAPRAGLALQAPELPVVVVGDAAKPGSALSRVQEDGMRAGTDLRAPAHGEVGLPPAPRAGIVCLCEDVSTSELAHAWNEGFRSTEILKRYTTATMGPCQGALCHSLLRAFVAAKSGATGPESGPTTSRPPARPITLENAAAGVRREVHQRTALHGRHLELGAIIEPAGVWRRPRHYGDPVAEYWAVRRAVSVMDVGTLGKFLVAGPDAASFLERLFPCRVSDLKPGRLRYTLLLGENGFVVDDGIVAAVEGGRWYVTFTSSGAAAAEALLKDWAETWSHDVRVIDLTSASGAINVAGPVARELLARLTPNDLANEAFPYLHHREIVVADVPCRAFRLGFVGELSYELHHPAQRSVELWDALLEAGSDLGIRPHGLDTLRTLRLEKGHIIVGQDTDFDTTPTKLKMDWAVKMEKPWFVGKRGILRAAAQPPLRQLIAVSFPGRAPREGATLTVEGADVGYLTSSSWSPVLECGVSLGWSRQINGANPTFVESDGIRGVVVDHPFYDPGGERLRG